MQKPYKTIISVINLVLIITVDPVGSISQEWGSSQIHLEVCTGEQKSRGVQPTRATKDSVPLLLD